MAESERYLPELLDKVEAILAANNLANVPITFRMTGYPNGWSRPYLAEIALTGRAPGKYNLYLGGGFHGQRLNRLVAENIGEEAILNILSAHIESYARERETNEHFGDFLVRTGKIENAANTGISK